MIWTGGQVDLSPDGRVLNPDNSEAQTVQTMLNLASVLHDLGCDPEDLVCLTCHYVNDGSLNEIDVLRLIAATLPAQARTCVVPVQVPYLAYDGLHVEIEGVAMRRPDGTRMARHYASFGQPTSLPKQFCSAIRSGKMIFVSCQTSGTELQPDTRNAIETADLEVDRLKTLLQQFGADLDDVVKCNFWHLADLPAPNVERAIETCLSRFRAPGPAFTSTPLPRSSANVPAMRLSCIAMRGEDGSRLVHRHAGFKRSGESRRRRQFRNAPRHGLRCEEMIFLGGQVSADRAVAPDMSQQTHQAMRRTLEILEELGAGINDVCKVTTYYQSGCGADALHANLSIRSSYFHDPGPTTTGIPLPSLSSQEALVEIETIAVSRPVEPGP